MAALTFDDLPDATQKPPLNKRAPVSEPIAGHNPDGTPYYGPDVLGNYQGRWNDTSDWSGPGPTSSNVAGAAMPHVSEAAYTPAPAGPLTFDDLPATKGAKSPAPPAKGALSFDDLPSTHPAAPAPEDTGYLGAITGGLQAAAHGVGRTIGMAESAIPHGREAAHFLAEVTPGGVLTEPGLEFVERAGETAPKPAVAAQPIEFSGPPEVRSVVEKTLHGLAEGVPSIAGAIYGGPAGAGAMTALQSFGPYYDAEIARTPDDKAGAYRRATENTAVDAAATAIGWKLFEFTPFRQAVGTVTNNVTGAAARIYKQSVADMIKNLMTQGLALQPAVSVAGQAVHNVINGDAPTTGLPSAYLNGALPNTLMMGLAHIFAPPGLSIGVWRRPEAGAPGTTEPFQQPELPALPAPQQGRGAGAPPPTAAPQGGAPAPATPIGLRFPDGTVRGAVVQGYSPDRRFVRLENEDGSVSEHLTSEVLRDLAPPPAPTEQPYQPAGRWQQLTPEEAAAPPLGEEYQPPPLSPRAARRAPQPELDPASLHALGLAHQLEQNALDQNVPMSTADRIAALQQVARLRQSYGFQGDETPPEPYRHPLAGEPAANLGELARARVTQPDLYQGEYRPPEPPPIPREPEVSRETPVPPPQRPQDLLQFLAASGGLRGDDPYHAGDLQAMDAHRKFIPGSGMLVRKTGGLPIDKAREIAAESGYGTDYNNFETTQDLLDAISDSLQGKDVFSHTEGGGFDAAAAWQDHKARLGMPTEGDEVQRHIDNLRAQADDYGIPYSDEWTAEDLMAAVSEHEAIAAERAGGEEPQNVADARELNMDYYLANRWPKIWGELRDEGVAEEPVSAEGQPSAEPEEAAHPGEAVQPPEPAARREEGAPGAGRHAVERGEAAPVPAAPEARLAEPQQPTEAERAARRGIEEARQLPRAHGRRPQRGANEGLFAPPPAAAGDLLARAEAAAEAEPSAAQIEAGNYKKGHVTVQGVPVTIETPAGAVRRGTGPNGPWEVTLRYPYGYVKRSKGADGEQVDVYVGPHTDSPDAFVVDQIDPATKEFDEHKAVLGARSEEEARAIYDAGFSDGSGPSRAGAITAMPVDEFRDWAEGGPKKHPLAYQEPVSAPAEITKAALLAEASDLGLSVPRSATREEVAAAIDARRVVTTSDADAAAMRNEIEMDVDRMAAAVLPEVSDAEEWSPAGAGEIGPQPPEVRGAAEVVAGPEAAGTEAAHGESAHAVPARGGQPGGEGAAPGISRPVDSRGSPIFKVGERVVLTEGPLAGRHGEISNVSGITMQSIFPGRGAIGRETTYHYTVKTDEGAETYASKFEPETAPPAKVVKDPVWEGKPVEPDYLQRVATNRKNDVARYEERGANARKPEKKAEWARMAKKARDESELAARTLADWKRANGVKIEPAAETPAVLPPSVAPSPVEGVDVRENAERQGVEIRFKARPDDAVLAKLKGAGFRWSKPQKLWYARISDRTRAVAASLKDVEQPPLPATPVTLDLGGKRYSVPSIEAARDLFVEARDRAGVGASETPSAEIVDHAGNVVAHISYNGRVWPGSARDWKPGIQPLIEAHSYQEDLTIRGAAQAAHAEQDAAEYQPAAMPITSASPPDKGVNPSDRLDIGDAVEPKPENLDLFAPGAVNRFVTDVSPDGRQVTLDGGAEVPATALQPAGEGSKSGHGVQGPISASHAGARTEAVSAAGEERPNRPVRAGEGSGSVSASGRPAGVRAEGAGRAAARPAGTAPSGRAGEGANVRLPGAGEGPEPGAAGRPDALVEGSNFQIEPGALEEGRGPKLKAADNLSAIRLAKQIIADDRLATREEQAVLAKYVGWGGLSGAFENNQGKFGTGFEDIGRDLKKLLTEDEYRTASRSTQYAHYTAENVIRSMWQAVEDMGFKGGSVFEPGMGVGHFLGLMPPDVAAKSQYQGIELDHLTADIAKLIYPQSGVRQADFTQTPLPDDTFDLVIGNPPFSDSIIKSDPKYAARNFMLHDYFFAKSLDAVRPGGLLAFVTSAGTMNKLDDSARTYLAQRAEFLGGARLPSTAFKKNAGTEVTTDVLFFKKRDEPISEDDAGKEPWTQVVARTLPDGEGGQGQANVSSYFTDHPEQVLGNEGLFDKLYKGRYAVHAPEGADLTENLRAALDRLPKNVMTQPEGMAARAEMDFAGAETKDGSFYLHGGKLMQYQGGVGRPVAKRGAGVEGGMSALDHERVTKLIPVRDALRDVFAHDLAENAADAAVAREALNRHYDAFVKKFGPINKVEFQYRRPNVLQEEGARAEALEQARDRGEPWNHGSFDPTPMADAGASLQEIARARAQKKQELGARYEDGSFDPAEMPDTVIEKRPNINPFYDDPESYRLRAIENYNEATHEHSKKRVFFESVLTRETEPKLDSANDGVLWSLNKFGRLDLDKIADQMKRDRSEIIAELGNSLFKVPNTEETYQTSDEYLSGDVVDKLAKAEAAAAHDPSVRRNVDALRAALPAPLSPSEISMNLGMPWMPPDTIEVFARDHMRIGEARIRHSPALGGWTVNDISNGADSAQWGTEDRPAMRILADALNRTPPRIYKEIYIEGEGKKREFDPIATQAVQDKYNAMREQFPEWVAQDPDRLDRLATVYNNVLNRTVLRKFDGSYLTTPGVASDWRWRPHQQRVVARIIQAGNTYVGHAVGAGKTSEMIGAGMEMRRLGLVKKPMFVVPNHMLAQFTKEFYEQYPTARIAVADERRFHTGRRKQFMANVAQSDLDAVIITHSSFGKIPIGRQFQRTLIQEELDNLAEAMSGLDKNDDRITIKKLENAKEKLEQRLQGAFNGRKDQTNTFEEMGVDHLFVDEAHMFRKLQFASRQNLKGIDPKGSDMAWDLYSKIRYLDSKSPGRSAVLASGTPVTNTMGELYTLSKYLQLPELKKRGIAHFDSWAATFGDTKTGLEQTPDGGYQSVTRFNRFVNIPELYKMVGDVMDIVTPAQLDQYVVRPKLKGGKRIYNLAPRSEFLDEYQADLARRMEEIKMRKGPPKKGDDIILSVINDGRKAAIDPRFVMGTGPQADTMARDSKLALMVDNVHNIWKATRDTQFYDPKTNYQAKAGRGPATQMIFSNLGINKDEKTGFSGYEWMKRELVRRGVPPKEIAMIGDYKGHVARQKLFNDMNEGLVRILIGSTQKMGTGVNAQRRLYAIHNLDPLWYPADDEQRVGRGLRQGNLNPEIEIHDYSTKGTYDSSMWQMMGNKGRFIEQFFRGDPELRDMEDLGEASHFEQAAAMATSDERLIELTDLRQQLDKAVRREQAHDREQYSMRSRLQEANRTVARIERQIPVVEADIKQRVPTQGDAFRMKVGAKTYSERAAATKALMDAFDQVWPTVDHGGTAKLASLGGFDLYAQKPTFVLAKEPSFLIQRSDGEMAELGAHTVQGSIRSLEARLPKFENELEYLHRQKAESEQAAASLQRQIGKPFEGGAEIDRLKKAVRALETAMAPKKEPTVADIDKQISANADDYHNGLVDHEAFTARARELHDKRSAAQAREAAAPKTGTKAQRPRIGGNVPRGETISLADDLIAKLPTEPSPREQALIHEVETIAKRIVPTARVRPARQLILRDRGRALQGEHQIYGATYTNGARKLIAWSMESPHAPSTLRHEAVHYLRNMNFLSPKEWETLSNAAEAGDWIGAHDIEDRYPDSDRADHIEEAIAEEFSHWAASGAAPKTPFERIFAKIKNLLAQVGAYLRKKFGKDATAADIFRSMESGEVGSRPGASAMERKEPTFAHRGQEDTPAFRDWFKDSKVVDGDGKPMVVYHGTARDFDEFKHPERRPDLGFHFGNQEQAESFANKPTNKGAHIKPVYLKIENPLRMRDVFGRGFRAVNSVAHELKRLGLLDTDGYLKLARTTPLTKAMADARGIMEKAGYDGVVYSNAFEGLHQLGPNEAPPPLTIEKNPDFGKPGETNGEYFARTLAGDLMGDGNTPDAARADAIRHMRQGPAVPTDSYIAFRPEQIKSATGNTGAFDPRDRSILRQEPRNPDGPPQTPEEGRDYIDNTARDLAEHLRSKGPGTYERTLQNLAPPSGPELFLRANWLQQHVMGPRTVAELDTKSATLWNAIKEQDDEGTQRIHDLRDHLKNHFLKLPKAGQQKAHAVRELDRLDNRVRVADGRSIVAANASHRWARGSKPGDRITLDGNGETEAYFELQAMDRHAWDNIMEGAARRMGWTQPWSPAMADNLKRITEAAETADHPRARKAFARLVDIMNAMEEQRRAAYMPMMRYGDYFVSVKPKVGKDEGALGGFPETKWFELVERPPAGFAELNPMHMLAGDVTKTGDVPDYAQARIDDLRKRFPASDYKIEHGWLFSKPENLRSLSIPAVEKLMMMMEGGVMDRLKNESSLGGSASKAAARAHAEKQYDDLYREVVDALQDEMYENLKAGFKRRSNTVAGYSPDFNRALGSYMNWTSRHVAQQVHGDTVERAYDDIQAHHPHQSIKDFWRKWREDDERPSSPLQRMGTTANQIGFLWTLAMNPASTFSIMMHGPVYAIPVLSTGAGMKRAAPAFAKAYGQAIAALRFNTDHGAYIDVGAIPGLTPDEKTFLAKMERVGDLHAKASDDVRSMAEKASALWGEYTPHARAAMDIASSNIAAADQANRVATALAAYRMARDGALPFMADAWKGNQVWRQLSHREGASPETMGKFLLTQGVGEWGAKGRSDWGRSWFGRMGTALHGFQIRFISNLIKQATRQGPAGRTALAWSLGALWAAAGLQGLPFVQDAENMIDTLWAAITKHDPMTAWRVRALLADTGLGRIGADVALRGPLSYLVGADMSRRLGFGDVLTRDVMPWFTGEQAALTFPSIVAGIGQGVAKRAASHQPAQAAASVLPAGLRHPVQAGIESRAGVKSQTGNTTYMTPKKITTGDTVRKALGLTPLDEAFARESAEFQYRAKHAHGQVPRNMTPRPQDWTP